MNVFKIFNLFKEKWSNLDFQLSDKSDDNKAVFTADITSKKNFDDSVYVRMVVFASGTVHVFMTFDQINRKLETYELINELNDSTSWVKGYITTINNKDFFQMHYAYYDAADEAEAADHCDHALNDLLDDNTLSIVAKICKYTY